MKARQPTPTELEKWLAEFPAGAGAVPRIRLDLPPEPFELWSFRAGLKPVVFLTVRPDDERKTLSFFGDVAVERIVRNVEVGPQDTWRDNRVSGDPRVELYVSHDAALARRAADLQARADPSRALLELGELLGYPKCCAGAFAAQSNRSDNTANRYATFSRTDSFGPWPWELNNLIEMPLAYFPCRYDCPSALAQARATLAQFRAVYPTDFEQLRNASANPVIYFDHPHRLILRGGAAVLLADAPPALEPLARALSVESIAPADLPFGFIAPFAAL